MCTGMVLRGARWGMGGDYPVVAWREIWEEIPWYMVFAGMSGKKGQGILCKLSWIDGETTKELRLESKSITQGIQLGPTALEK